MRSPNSCTKPTPDRHIGRAGPFGSGFLLTGYPNEKGNRIMPTSEEFAKTLGAALIYGWVRRTDIADFLGGNKKGVRQRVMAFAAANGLVAEKVFPGSHRNEKPVQYHVRPPAIGEEPGQLTTVESLPTMKTTTIRICYDSDQRQLAELAMTLAQFGGLRRRHHGPAGTIRHDNVTAARSALG